jgi:hypothetical protein
VPVHPDSQRDRAHTLDTDPLRYLRGVLAFFLGSGALIALVLALTGVAPKALVLAGLLWALLGILTGLVDLVLEPVGELAGGALARLGFTAGAGARPDRVTALLEHAAQLAGPLQQPEAAAAELLALQRNTSALSPGDDIRIGLALAALFEQQLQDPGRALGELRRLIDRHPQLRQTAQLRSRLAELRARHFASPTP